MPDIEVTESVAVTVSFEVYCECGEGLCANSSVTRRRGYPCVIVEPCPKCQQREYDKGHEAGYDKGFDYGKNG